MRWKEWIRDNVKRGARNAHVFLRDPVSWEPTVTREVRSDGPVGKEDEAGEGGVDDEAGTSGSRNIVSASPLALLEDQLDKWSSKWQATSEPFDYDWSGWEEASREKMGREWEPARMEHLDATRLREAAKTFKPGTSETYDGFHVRHLAMLATRP